MLNIAQALVKLSVNATCWKAAAPKVASNSSEWPAAKVALVPAKAPSTCSAPPETVALPPAASALALPGLAPPAGRQPGSARELLALGRLQGDLTVAVSEM